MRRVLSELTSRLSLLQSLLISSVMGVCCGTITHATVRVISQVQPSSSSAEAFNSTFHPFPPSTPLSRLRHALIPISPQFQPNPGCHGQINITLLRGRQSTARLMQAQKHREMRRTIHAVLDPSTCCELMLFLYVLINFLMMAMCLLPYLYSADCMFNNLKKIAFYEWANKLDQKRNLSQRGQWNLFQSSVIMTAKGFGRTHRFIYHLIQLRGGPIILDTGRI